MKGNGIAKHKSLDVWACLVVNPLEMPKTPYHASEGKHSVTHHALSPLSRSGDVSSAIWLVIVGSVVQLNRVIAQCQTDVPGSRKNND